MWPVIPNSGIGVGQADAVFASGLQRGDEPSAGQVRQAAASAIHAFGYSGCAERVAQEFGDHPETAVIRMRWARAVACDAFADTSRSPLRLRMTALLIARPRLLTEQTPSSREAMA